MDIGRGESDNMDVIGEKGEGGIHCQEVRMRRGSREQRGGKTRRGK